MEDSVGALVVESKKRTRLEATFAASRVVPTVLLAVVLAGCFLLYYFFTQGQKETVRGHYETLIDEAAEYARDAFDAAARAGLNALSQSDSTLKVDLTSDRLNVIRVRGDTAIALNLGIHHWTGQNRFRTILIAGSDREIIKAVGRDRPHSLPAAVFSRSPDSTRHSYAGVKYDHFVRDVVFPNKKEKNGRSVTVTGHTDWTMVGLVETTVLRTSAQALPPLLLLVIVLGIAITILAYPFLKVALLGPTGRITKHDVFVLSVDLVIASAFVTFFVIEVVSYNRHRDKLDMVLVDTAESIDKAFTTEVRLMDRQLRHLNRIRQDRGESSVTTQVAARPWMNGGSAAYPFFKMAYWIGQDGQQKEKWTVKNTNTNSIPVGNRKYFKEPLLGHLNATQHAAQDETLAYAGWYIESIRSWNEAVVYAVVTQRLKPKSDSVVVAALLSPMLSTIRPVLLPSIKFAIIDNQGLVQFHSAEIRNLRENLFEAVGSSVELRTAVASHTSARLTADYRGRPTRIYVKPLRHPAWSVIVLGDYEPIFATHGGILRYGLYVYVGYLSTLALALGLIHWALGRSLFQAGYLFRPQSRKGGDNASDRGGIDYQRVFFGELTIGVALVLLAFSSSPVTLTLGATALAVWGLVFYYGHLTPEEERISVWAALPALLLAALGIVLTAVAVRAGGAYAVVVFLIAGTICVLLLPGSRVRQSKDPETHFRYHRFSVFTLIAVLGVLPLCSLYRAVHDEVGLATTKRTQLALTQSLANRAEERIQWYSDVVVNRNSRANLQRHLLPANTRPDSVAALNASWDVHLPNNWTAAEEWRQTPAHPSSRIASTSAGMDGGLEESQQRLIDFFRYARTPPDQELDAFSHATSADSSHRWFQFGRANDSLLMIAESYRHSTRLGKLREDENETARADVALVLTSQVVNFSSVVNNWYVLIACLTIVPLLLYGLYRLIGLLITWVFLTAVRPKEVKKDAGSRSASATVVPARTVPASTYTITTAPGSESLPDSKTIKKALRDKKVVHIIDFESGLETPEKEEEKLVLIENIRECSTAEIIIHSSINPEAYLTQKGLAELQTSEVATAAAGDSTENSSVRKKNAETNKMIARLARWHEVFRHVKTRIGPAAQTGLSDEARYMSLWTLCSTEEKLILHRIAKDGFVSWRGLDVVRALMDRGIVDYSTSVTRSDIKQGRIGPLNVTKDEFRNLILQVLSADAVSKLAAHERRGLWEKLRTPAIFVLAAIGGFVVITQPAAFESTVTVVSALGAGVLAVVKLVTVLFDGKRQLTA